MDAESLIEVIKGFQAIHGKSVGVKIAGCEVTSVSVEPELSVGATVLPAYIDIVGQ